MMDGAEALDLPTRDIEPWIVVTSHCRRVRVNANQFRFLLNDRWSRPLTLSVVCRLGAGVRKREIERRLNGALEAERCSQACKLTPARRCRRTVYQTLRYRDLRSQIRVNGVVKDTCSRRGTVLRSLRTLIKQSVELCELNKYSELPFRTKY